jgi:hypothetical protein
MNHMDGKFRAPQLSFGREQEERPGSGPAAKSELMRLFRPAVQEPAAAATVVIKRRRVVATPPADGEGAGSPSPATARGADGGDAEPRQRVFRVDRREAEPAPPAQEQPPQPSQPAVVSDDAEAAVPLAPRRRRRTPRQAAQDARRPGEVVVTRPQAPVVVPLSQLEDELAQATRLLESLATAPRTWDFDLGAAARWAAVDDALGKLKSTVAPRPVALAGRRR